MGDSMRAIVLDVLNERVVKLEQKQPLLAVPACFPLAKWRQQVMLVLLQISEERLTLLRGEAP